ncbi:MAG: TetR family transcriptional regulator [Actinobacteria bacterium]|nr:TetR family transcriptional regulator [Actinomycetota bacterium]
MESEETGGIGEASPRDRLRDAALDAFARRGLGATVREIAADAGVTAGLITHHFGSRDALRQACDDEALRRIRALKEDGIHRSPDEQLAMIGTLDAQGATLAYLLRVIRAGGPAANTFLEHAIADAHGYIEVAVAEGIVKPSRDSWARARMLVLNQFGGLLLQADLAGLELSDGAAIIAHVAAEQTLPLLELYADGLLTDRTLFERYLALGEGASVSKEQP